MVVIVSVHLLSEYASHIVFFYNFNCVVIVLILTNISFFKRLLYIKLGHNYNSLYETRSYSYLNHVRKIIKLFC